MKKTIALVLCLITGLLAVSCGEPGQDGSPAPGENSTEDPSTSTLMIYMIGSDLESKRGAATDDLTEILESGVDVGHSHVVICTGGTTRWHNDHASADVMNILKLDSGGYSVEKTLETSSMGESETLASFLNYAAEAYPADHYALILWDHGNGPLIGYGKDVLFGNDSLTLPEMAGALEASPFQGGSKLEWIGFDACLMASAELSCVLAPFAKYLIASQEVEPAFGWNYGFLKNYGKTPTVSLLGNIAEDYLDSCEAYFEEKNYKGRDATLACVDLSGAAELKDALNSLFALADSDLEENYDRLASVRAVTRSLGRASTGSEYDLVDLKDLAQRMKEDYPAQAARLAAAADAMVVTNVTNAEGLCGMSLYYPFFNKSYYRNTWGDVYQDMDVFSDYIRYLSDFAEIWLNEDLKEDFAVSRKPALEAGSDYTLTLTDDQMLHYASARYYILSKKAGETYTKVYSSSDVTYADGKLTANFDGNIIYARNELGEYTLPVVTEHDTVDSITNYSIDVQLSSVVPERKEEVPRYVNGRFLIGANKSSGEISISALTPQASENQEDDLTGGKQEDVDITAYRRYTFWNEPSRILARGKNKVVKPVDQWIKKGNRTGEVMNTGDGLEFVYEPLDYGQYALIFEICDTQNSWYCSEPIDIRTNSVTMRPREQKEPVVVNSDGVFPILLKEDANAAVYLDAVEVLSGTASDSSADSVKLLTLTVENKNDHTLEIIGNNIICNDSISCHNGTAPRFKVKNGKKLNTNIYFEFGDAAYVGALKSIGSLSFEITLLDASKGKALWLNEPFVIRFDEGKEFPVHPRFPASYNPICDNGTDPLFGAVVPVQTAVDNETLRLEVLGIGSTASGAITGACRITNRSDKPLYFELDALAIDDVYLDTRKLISYVYPYTEPALIRIEPGMDAYRLFGITAGAVTNSIITGAEKLDLCYRIANNMTSLLNGYGDVFWANVRLDETVKAIFRYKTGSVLMSENGVTVSVLNYKPAVSDDGADLGGRWYLLLENEQDDGVLVKIADLDVNGQIYTSDKDTLLPLFMNGARCGPHQQAVITATANRTIAGCEAVFSFDVFDFTGTKRLFSSSKRISLNPNQPSGVSEEVTEQPTEPETAP